MQYYSFYVFIALCRQLTIYFLKQPVNNRAFNGNARANGGRVGLLRYGDVEGVRQSSGNWQRESIKWIRRTYVQPLQYSRLQSLRQAVYENFEFENNFIYYHIFFLFTVM